jgi:hypothetical protein
MKAVKVETDGSIKLPEETLRLFQPAQIAERVSEKEMPLKDIAAKVHRMRREAHRRRG